MTGTGAGESVLVAGESVPIAGESVLAAGEGLVTGTGAFDRSLQAIKYDVSIVANKNLKKVSISSHSMLFFFSSFFCFFDK